MLTAAPCVRVGACAQVSEQVYPVWTYAYLCLLVFVFLLTDLVRYKPMIVFEALGYMATWTLLIWGRGVFQMQVSGGRQTAESCELVG